jgi:diguanylate cyclase (GGDEF)-like protein/PAS domain S-box-containing protein
MSTEKLVLPALADFSEPDDLLHLQVAALEAAANPILISRRDGTIVWVNFAFEQLSGYSRQEVMGENTRLLRSGKQQPVVYADLWATILSGQKWRGELINQRKNGSLYQEEMTITPVKNASGEITHFIAIKLDITERKKAEEQIRMLALSDPLTGLANYRQLLDVLDSEIKRYDRTDRPFAILLLDLDELKKINDIHGHLAGSRAIIRVADVLRLQLREIDTPARYGGDEFVVVLPETGPGATRKVARRISQKLREDPEEPRISVSSGAAIFPDDGKNIDELLAAADRALYREKRSHGRLTSRRRERPLLRLARGPTGPS